MGEESWSVCPLEPDVNKKSPIKSSINVVHNLCPQSSGSLLETENVQHHSHSHPTDLEAEDLSLEFCLSTISLLRPASFLILLQQISQFASLKMRMMGC